MRTPPNPPPRLEVGQTLYRVAGELRGETLVEGVDLRWEEWVVQRLTPKGAWLVSTSRYASRKPRFALASGCRWASPTKKGALRQLIHRKVRHLQILAAQQAEATEVRQLAFDALEKLIAAEKEKP